MDIGRASDSQILQILKGFAPIVVNSISDGGKFNARYSNRSLNSSAVLNTYELNLWEEAFSLCTITTAEANNGLLFVPSDVSAKSHAYRINLEETIYQPVESVNVDAMQYFLNVSSYISGYLSGPGHLYNAFIAMDVYVKDRQGKWVIAQIPGSGVVHGSHPVFSPFRPYGASLWFNTRIDVNKPNKLNIVAVRQNDMMLSAQINRFAELGKVSIPDDDRLRFWFWQLGRRGIPWPTEGDNPMPEVVPMRYYIVRKSPVSIQAKQFAGQRVVVDSYDWKTDTATVFEAGTFLSLGAAAVPIPASDLIL